MTSGQSDTNDKLLESLKRTEPLSAIRKHWKLPVFQFVAHSELVVIMREREIRVRVRRLLETETLRLKTVSILTDSDTGNDLDSARPRAHHTHGRRGRRF